VASTAFRTAALAGAVALAFACLLPAARAQAARPLTVGFADPAFVSADPTERDRALDFAGEVGAGIVRLPVFWSSLVAGEPANASDPADPAYDFGRLDEAIAAASRRGFQVLLTVTTAPAFAEGPGRPGFAPAGSWKPAPAALAQFATALATRYSGSYAGAGGPLPRVTLYQAWNEPNLETYLSPQYENGAPMAPAHYRKMLNAFFDAVKAVSPGSRVITAGTGPYGDEPGAGRTRPLAFWREVLCLSRALKALSCPTAPRFDVLAHHPINTSGGPRVSARDPDDASTPDFHNVVEILRAAERRGMVGTPGRHHAWATEMWWESDPPDAVQGVPLRRHARWLALAQYLLWRQGARVVLSYPVVDLPYDPNAPLSPTSSGIRFVDGSAKPAASALAFPLVVDRKRGARAIVWGRAPAAGRLLVERRSGGRWRRAHARRLVAGETFKVRTSLERTRAVRARIGNSTSLPWAVKAG
jgi:hypothetical protein